MASADESTMRTPDIQAENKVDVLIVGAGLSGLTAALRLQQKDPTLKMRVLEAMNFIGGEVTTTHLGEVGAKWFTSDQIHIFDLLRNLNIPMTRRVTMAAELETCSEIDEKRLSSLIHFELNRYITELDLRWQFFKPGTKGYKNSRNINVWQLGIHSKTLISAETANRGMSAYINHRLFFNDSRLFMRNLVLIISGVDAEHISYADFMRICYTAVHDIRFNNKRNAYYFYRFVEAPPGDVIEFSSNELFKRLLQMLDKTQFVYGRDVVEIHQFRTHVEVRDIANESHMADVVILAIPFNNLKRIYFWPRLPREMEKSLKKHNGFQYVVTSFLASYPDGYWRRKGFNGDYIGINPLMICHEYRPKTYCGYVILEQGLETLTRTLVLQRLAEYYGNEMLSPLEFQQRSYDVSKKDHLPLTTPWSRVIWASSAAAGTCFRGCLSGAVQSGLRAAMNALLLLRPQLVTWKDIADVQCRDMPREQASVLTLWLSTLNLYNVTTYAAFITGLIFILNRFYKRPLSGT
ncbi:LOW QUALITY PROTEIN: putative monoamine oxidase sheepish [Glossina fuscipes fuscipes]